MTLAQRGLPPSTAEPSGAMVALGGRCAWDATAGAAATAAPARVQPDRLELR